MADEYDSLSAEPTFDEEVHIQMKGIHVIPEVWSKSHGVVYNQMIGYHILVT